MAHLALALLGPFQATLDGLPVEGLTSSRLRALLAYLAVERRRQHPREQVASLLWPERPDREAVASLRSALSKLRTALGDRRSPGDGRAPLPFLLVSRTSVQFNEASDHCLDVVEFERMAGRGRGDPAPTDLSGLTAAASLYRGPFLHGLSVGDSPAFEDWLLQRDEEYRRSMLSVLERLTLLQMERGVYAEVARWARRQIELEPYREQAHRQLMLALALSGERSAALSQYETCRRLLTSELGCEPEDETQALYAQIRDGTLLLPTGRLGDTEARGYGDAVTRGYGDTGTRRESPPLRVSQPPRLLLSASCFVAREQEMARLGTLLDQALTGRGGVALIAGEAGSGKTALLDEFARWAGVTHGDLIALRGSCNAHGGAGDPYLPFREILQTFTGNVEGKRAGGTLSPAQAQRIWEALPAVGAALVEHGPDLINTFVPGEPLLRRVEGFPGPARNAPWLQKLRESALGGRSGEGTATQSDLFAQVTQVLHSVSLGRPLLLAVDDLQWADGGTAALLFHLGRRLAGSRILLACAFRPEAVQASLDPGGPGHLGDLGAILHELAREWGDVRVDLDEADGRGFVEAYVDSEPNRLGAGFRQALYHHTGGNPLFTVELLHSFERRGELARDEAGQWIEAPVLDWDHVPARVEAVIAGHLRSLPDDDQALLRAASVQGERFAAEIAARVLSWSEEATVQRLSGPLRARHRLVEAVSLERLSSSGQRLSTYRFRHALLQRGAYNSLDAVERAWLHETTARTLEAFYVDEDQRPLALAPELARHYEAAGMPLQAARALHDAGRQAVRLSALREALDLFDRGLALIAGAPASPERAEAERLLQVAQLIPRSRLEGSGSLQLEDALAQALEAGAGEAQGLDRLMTLQAEADHLIARGQFEAVLVVAQQMLDLATQEGDEGLLAYARFWFGFANNIMGRPLEAEGHFNWIVARQRPGKWAKLRAAVGYDVTAHALTFSGINQWLLGYPEQALSLSTRAVDLSLELGDLYGQAFASACGSTTLFLLRSDSAALQARSDLCQRVCEQHGFAWWGYFSEVFLGWLAVRRGDDPAGIERMQRAMVAWQSTGMVIGTDALVVTLADGCLAAANRYPEGGNAERARLLAIGLAAVECWIGPDVPCGQGYQAELHRMRGELLLARDGLAAAGEALASFQRAEQIGRDQGALGWELRAAMSLVRLRQRQGEACAAQLAEARNGLRELYGRFTEGFAFPDLQDAAALIGA